MSELLIQHYIETYGLVAIFLLMCANGFFSFPPSEITLSVSGVLAFATRLDFVSILLVAIFGNLAGTYLLYLVGRYWGYSWVIRFREFLLGKNAFLQRLTHYIPGENTLRFIETKISHEGAIWVGILRCFPLIRSIVSLPAGMMKMPRLKFIFLSFSGIALWAIGWISLGYFFSNLWRTYSQTTSIVLIGALLLILLFFLNYLKRKIRLYDGEQIPSGPGEEAQS